MPLEDRFLVIFPEPQPQDKRHKRCREADFYGLTLPTHRPIEDVVSYDIEVDDGPWPGPLTSYEKIVDYIGIQLKYLQGYHRPYGNDQWLIWFPFEIVPLSQGTRVYCYNRNVTWTVKDADNKKAGVYRLEPTGQPPTESDILYVGEENRLRFMVGYPNSTDTTSYFTTEELRKNAKEPFRPTVTYRFIRVEPAGTRSYFGGTTQHKPVRMPFVKYEEDGVWVQPTLNLYDVELQFDCWGKTNQEAVWLARRFRTAMKWIIPVLRGCGLMTAHFIQQKMDIHLTRRRNDIVARSLVYRMRLQEVDLWKAHILDYIHTRIAVSPSGDIGMSFTASGALSI